MEQTLAQPIKKKKKNKNKNKIMTTIFIILMCAYPLLQFTVFWLYTNIDTIVLSFQRYSFKLRSEYWTLDNYREIFENWKQSTQTGNPNELLNCIKNSVILFAVNNFLILPIAIFCAYIFFKKMPGSSIFRVIFFLPNIISIVVLTMAFSFMFDSSFGPVNSFLNWIGLGSIIPDNGWLSDFDTAMPMVCVYCLWAGIGYDVVLITGAINRIPEEVIEAGKLDGIGMWRELFNIVVPMIFPTITTLFVQGVTVIFTIFLQPKLLVSGVPNYRAGTIALYIVDLVDNGNKYGAAAVGIIFTLIGIPIIQFVKWGMEKISPDVEY